MDYKTLFNKLYEMVDFEEKEVNGETEMVPVFPEFFDKSVVVHMSDDLSEVRLLQDLDTGELIFAPVFND